jgi:hypothetical protein
MEEGPHIRLTVSQERLPACTSNPHNLLLKRDILDKQIVDIQGFRIVKVNDLKLAQVKNVTRLVGVDISLVGLLRRLGMDAFLTLLSRVLKQMRAERIITWNYVQQLQMNSADGAQLTPELIGFVPQVQLSVSHNKLGDLLLADITAILEQFDVDLIENVPGDVAIAQAALSAF